MNSNWPFQDAENVAVFTVRGVVRDGHPILRVVHDVEDGAWQFLEWDTPEEKDAMILTLSEIVEFDPTVRELADLPFGWQATRRNGDDPWHREPNLKEGS